MNIINTTPAPNNDSKKKGCLIGCLVVGVIALVIAGIFVYYIRTVNWFPHGEKYKRWVEEQNSNSRAVTAAIKATTASSNAVDNVNSE